MEDVSYYAYIDTFTNAFRAIRETNVFFTNQFKGKVNSHINVLFQLDLVYDPDFSRRMQLAQTFSAGLSLNIRSEEHTSELQSRGHLVCRLLLEKKKAQAISFR